MGLVMELVPEHISFRLRSVSCKGLHEKTIVRFKLQNIAKSTKPARNLGDHTHESFEFNTTVHNMTFDIVKIDVYDFKKSFGQNVKIGRAYLPLRELQKKVGNKYDNDGDDNTEPEQSVLSSRFDAAAFCKKHSDIFEIDLPLFKHGSYSKFSANHGQPHSNSECEEEETIITKGSEHGKDIAVVTRQPRPALGRTESYVQQAKNGVEVGMITVQATLCFKDQTQDPLFAHLGKGSSNSVESLSQIAAKRSRSQSNESIVSVESSSTTSPPNGSSPGRILQAPTSPPNLSLHYGGSNGSPLSPPSSPTNPSSSPGSPNKCQWLSDKGLPQGTTSSWESESTNDEGDFDDNNTTKSHYKGENMTEADRAREEEMMANIMANGDQAKKDEYLRKSLDERTQRSGLNPKNKKTAKFSFFSEQTRSAFKDIQLMYSSFFDFIRFNSDRKNVMDYFRLKKEDMIVWHFDKRTALVPSYYIVRDPKYNALCIIIRGTFSVTDAMTDLVCEYYPYKGGLVHKGIMDNARFVLERSGKDIEAALKKFNLNTIYCIGHSLGAGSASLLCALLQDRFANYTVPATAETSAQKLQIKAYLFAPPPIATPNLAAEWESTQIAFINENDIVCRMSYGNALDLKELIKTAAIESMNPVYNGLKPKEKLDRIMKVLEKAQESLRAVEDVPRLVTTGTVTYLHKVYESTPVIQNKSKDRSSRFGEMDYSQQASATAAAAAAGAPNSVKGTKNNKGTKDSVKEHVPGRTRSGTASSTGSKSLTRSLSALTTALTPHKSSHSHSVSRHNSQVKDNHHDGTSSRQPKVTPYDPTQAPVRLSGVLSFDYTKELSASTESEAATLLVDSPLATPSSERRQEESFEPVQYEACKEAREKACRDILEESHQGRPLSALGLATTEDEQLVLEGEGKPKYYTSGDGHEDHAIHAVQDTDGDGDEDLKAFVEENDDNKNGQDEDDEYDQEEEEEEEDQDHRVYTTQKPRKNGSKRKEIRIEFSDKAHFMAIPLRTNWLWHHFPQQYDSRVERALAWAKAHKEAEDRKRKIREEKFRSRQKPTASR
ncbi:hypothetical protein BGZ94_005466 [Podila epigama]|nr:hypothetical protein BGZ94_005466 [Podila epigama]